MRRWVSIVLLLVGVGTFAHAQPQTEKVYLSGTGYDNTVPWDFYCTAGRNSGKWTQIAVPSCWELQGFGTYNYGKDRLKKSTEKGLYRHRLAVPAAWRDRVVDIVFDGSMTDTEVRLNGKLVGPIHRGSFYQFRYSLNKFLEVGKENLLEVTVAKHSADSSVNEAERKGDYWLFGGIFRPVWLEVKPLAHIDYVHVDARANGEIRALVHPAQGTKAQRVQATVYDGERAVCNLDQPWNSKAAMQELAWRCTNVTTWNPERPKLYTLQVDLLDKGGAVLHRVRERIGFRTVELRPEDGLYVNGVKVLLQGANRHSIWPESGRTTSNALSIADVEVMKSMGMNAVRMSHYPPDAHFLDVCDSLGLFVLDELGGWHGRYSVKAGLPLLREMLRRDVNHPSIIIWDNGNEGGNNDTLYHEFAKLDLQKRPVIEPWEIKGGFDTQHYRPWNCCTGSLYQSRNLIMPTEFLHALWDGGGGAGLEDAWNLLTSKPTATGGFIWCLVDEGIIRRDKGDSIDVFGNFAPDGLLGPHREKEGSYYTVRDIWAPIQIRKVTRRGDSLQVGIKNAQLFTDLAGFSIEMKNAAGNWQAIDAASLAPGAEKLVWVKGQPGLAHFRIESKGRQHDGKTPAFNLDKTFTWPAEPAPVQPVALAVTLVDSTYQIKLGKVTYYVGKKSGRIQRVDGPRGTFPLTNGPALAVETATIKEVIVGKTSLTFYFTGWLQKLVYEAMPDGQLSLTYKYTALGTYDYLGINFSLPEKQLDSVQYQGVGPFRVWKNRLRGGYYSQFTKKPQQAVLGQDFIYPEFGGYYADVRQMALYTKGGKMTVGMRSLNNHVCDNNGLYLRLYTPPTGSEQRIPGTTSPPFPAQDISIMHAIPAMGDKFLKPEQTGPQGQKNMLYGTNNSPISLEGQLLFRLD